MTASLAPPGSNQNRTVATSATGASPRSRGDAQRSQARAYAAAQWADLRDRLLTITPRAAGRAFLTVAVTAGVVATIAATWPALMPFVVGGVIAWGALPLVDALDRLMPRPLAAVISVLTILAVFIAVVVAILPPFAFALIEFARQIPGQDQINVQVANLLAGLPTETRQIVEPIIATAATVAGDTLNGSSGSLRDIVQTVIQAVPQIAGAVLGPSSCQPGS